MSKPGFVDTLRKYLGGKLSNADKDNVDNWVDSLSTDEEEQHISWDRADQTALFDKIKNKIANPERNMAPPTISMGFWLKAAASLTLLIVASYLIVQFTVSPSIDVADFVDQKIEKSILNDGTIVWLKAESKLSFYESADGIERHANLKGEGFFEVAKDATRPFIIACGEVEVRVLGTSFSLKANSDSVELKLLTGKVTISTPDYKSGLDVSPYEKVIFTKGITHKTKMREQEVPATINNSDYNMKFDNSSMQTVIGRIEKKFNVECTIANDKLNACHITADFTDVSLERTLQMISEVYDIKYVINGNTVSITGSGCQ